MSNEKSLFSRLSSACAAFSFAIRTNISMGNSWNYIRNNWFIKTRRTKTLGYNRNNSMYSKNYCNISFKLKFIKCLIDSDYKEKMYD